MGKITSKKVYKVSMEPCNVVQRQYSAIKFIQQSNIRKFIEGWCRWTQHLWCELPDNVPLWTH